MRSGMMLALVCLAIQAEAVLGQTWDGGGTTNNWTDANNWSPNNVPPNNGAATLNFAGNTRLAPIVNTNFDVRGLTFDNQAGAFNIGSSGGATLTLREAGITNNGSSTQSLGVPLVLAAPQTWGGAGTIGAVGTVNLGTSQLTVDTPVFVGLTGVVSGSGSIVKVGGGSLQLTNANSFTGGITLREGYIEIGNNGGLGTGTLRIEGGSIAALGAARSIANAIDLAADLDVAGSLGVTITGPLTLKGKFSLDHTAAVAISGPIGQDAPGRELIKTGAGTLTLSGSALTLGTSLTLDQGTLSATGLVNSAGSTFTQNAGTLNGSLTNRGNFVYNGGMTSGNLANEAGGDATFNANFTLTAVLNNAGTIHVPSGKTLTFGTQTLNNTGTIELTGGALSASGATTFSSSGLVTGFGTISANNSVFNNSGQVTASGGGLTITTNMSPVNSGIINIPMAAQLQLNTTSVTNNTGLVRLTGGSISGTGPIANNSGGEIRGSGTVQSAVTNAGGLVHATGSDPLIIQNLSGGNSAGGELRIDEGATMTVASTFSSSGTVMLGGNNASLNVNTMNNSGTIRGSGRITGTVQNNGTIRAEGGTLTLAGSGNTNPANGHIEAGPDGQVIYTQGLATNTGLIALAGGAMDNNNLALANPGRIEGSGTLRTGGLTNTGTVSVAGALDVFGAVTNNNVVNASSGSTIRYFGPVSGSGSFSGSGTNVFLNTFSPGASPAAVSFAGGVDLGAAQLNIEIGGSSPGTQFDQLDIQGAAALGGTLSVSLLNNFAPTAGATFEIISAAGGIEGAFAATTLPTLAEGLNWNVRYAAKSVSLAVVAAVNGDYNGNGVVDAADYITWRIAMAHGGTLLNDASPGSVSQQDYTYWRAHFGAAAGSGSGDNLASGAVPEPSALLLTSILLMVLGSLRCPRHYTRARMNTK
jgi:fibronectin-binding autotransporter adhesin